MEHTNYAFDPATGHPLGLSAEFAPYLDRITPLPAVYVTYGPLDPRPEASRIGGSALVPPGFELPTGGRGQALSLLAQLNLEDLGPLPGFPARGLLQLFIHADGEMYGSEPTDAGTMDDLHVAFHPDLHADSPALAEAVLIGAHPEPSKFGGPHPAKAPFGLTFAPPTRDLPSSELAGPARRVPGHYPNFLDLPWDDDGLAQRLEEEYNTLTSYRINYAKVGGYPCFFNSHPGERDPALYDYDRLLLQLPTDGNAGINWWGSGTANFLVRAKDLANADFSDVLYSIDT